METGMMHVQVPTVRNTSNKGNTQQKTILKYNLTVLVCSATQKGVHMIMVAS